MADFSINIHMYYISIIRGLYYKGKRKERGKNRGKKIKKRDIVYMCE